MTNDLNEHVLIADDGTELTVRIVPQSAPTNAAPFHPNATHRDALGMPVAFVDLAFGDGEPDPWPYHPTPCCGAGASISDGPMYCKACYAEVDMAFGNHPVEPYEEVELA